MIWSLLAINEVRWSFYHTTEDFESLLASLSEQGIRESELKKNLLDQKEKITGGLAKSNISEHRF